MKIARQSLSMSRLFRVKQQRGLTLLEILITLATVSVGLLGVAALQIKGVQSSQDGFRYTQATFIANDLAERIRANVDEADSYNLDDDASPAQQDCRSGSCSGAEMAAADLYEWRHSATSVLGPEATSSVVSDDDSAIITVTWDSYGVEKTYVLNVEW